MASHLSRVLALAWLVLAFSQGAISASVATPKCSSSDMNMIKASTKHAMFFCNFYVARERAVSPFPGLSAERAVAACLCMGAVVHTAPVVGSGGPLLPTPSLAAQCDSQRVAIVKSEFSNSLAFCRFFEDWSASGQLITPIPNLTTRQVSNACECIIKNLKSGPSSVSSATFTNKPKPQSTSKPTSKSSTKAAAQSTTRSATQEPTKAATTPVFCSSAPVVSLSRDSHATSFCWHVLQASPVTTTSTAYMTPVSTIEETTVVSEISTSFFVTPSALAYRTDYSTLPVPSGSSYPIYCGTSQKPKARRAEPTLIGRSPVFSTPLYLTSSSPAYVTSACRCQEFPSPTVIVTITETASTSYVTQPVVLTAIVTDDVVVSSGVATATVTLAANATGVPQPMDAYWNVKVNSNSSFYVYQGLALQYTQSEYLGSCKCGYRPTCDLSYGTLPSYSANCAGYDDCAQACAWYNEGGQIVCTGAIYDGTAETCTFLQETRPLIDADSCAVPEVVNSLLFVVGLYDFESVA